MWILKGTLLGLLIFVLAAVTRILYALFTFHLPPGLPEGSVVSFDIRSILMSWRMLPYLLIIPTILSCIFFKYRSK